METYGKTLCGPRVLCCAWLFSPRGLPRQIDRMHPVLHPLHPANRKERAWSASFDLQGSI